MLRLSLLFTWVAGAATLGLSVPGVPLPNPLGTNVTSQVPGVDTVKSVAMSGLDAVAPEDVCFDYLGCFSMTQPWYSLLRPLPTPHKPEDIDTKFYLYSRRSPQRWNVTKLPKVSLMGSPFDGNKMTFVITHGFASDGNSSWLSNMKDAILKKFDANVFLVDWGKGASNFNYFQVASNTRIVGAEITRLIDHTREQYGFHPSRLHLVGHSLGAHISSYAAKEIRGVARLTALDPAQPAFEGFGESVRLDQSDAEFVQVLHTSARPFIPFIGLGMIRPVGDVDYYLNGGWQQPGCHLPPKPNITSFFDLAMVPVEVISNYISCPHGRSYEFFTSSLLNDNCTFWGHITSTTDNVLSTLTLGHAARKLFPNRNCTAMTCSPLGIESEEFPARGSFDVATTSHFPYCVPEPDADVEMRHLRRL